MAAFAVIGIGRTGELAPVLVLVTIGAVGELQLENRVLALRDVALSAVQLGVSALQRILRLRMLCGAECRRLERVHGMAV